MNRKTDSRSRSGKNRQGHTKRRLWLLGLLGVPLAIAAAAGHSDVYARSSAAAYNTSGSEAWLDGIDPGTGSLGMRVNVTGEMIGFMYEMRTVGLDECGARLSVYRWEKDFKTTTAAEPVATKFIENIKNNSTCQLMFADDPQPAGEYLLLVHETCGNVGCRCITWEAYEDKYGLCYENGMENRLNLKLSVAFSGEKPDEPFKTCSPQSYGEYFTPPAEYIVPEDSLIRTHEVLPDTWVFTDALGRESLTYKDVGPIREDRTVAMFYWTWNISGSSPAGNVQEAIDQYPEAQNDYSHPVWKTGVRYFWDEPIYGYYLSNDQWVLRRQAELLANAGVDTIFTDNTNSIRTYRQQYLALYEAWTAAMNDGVNTPKVSFMLPFNGTNNAYIQMRSLFNNIYSKGAYQPLWFYWDGKPMLMAQVWGINRSGDVESNMLDFFTIRKNLPYYLIEDKMEYGAWGWLSMYPQAIYYKNAADEAKGKAEQITVGVAQNHNYVTHKMTAMNGENVAGRSYTSDLSHIDEAGVSLWGYNFAEQFEYALKVDPRVIFITGWNEWNVGREKEWQGVKNAFPDEFDDEYSRDLEPSRGALKDNYYYQLVNFVRRYKGAHPIPKPGEAKTISLGGGEAQWDNVEPYYAAYIGNTGDRDALGYGNVNYTDFSGRNDIIGAKVSRDSEYLYFHVECYDNITPYTDNLWMNLLIDCDASDSGWNTFNYVVNKTPASEKTVVLERFTGNGYDSEKIADCEYETDGRFMTVKIRKADLGIDGDDFTVNFAWTDNVHDVDDTGTQTEDGKYVYSTFSGDIMEFYVSGDVAPGGRFKFCYDTSGLIATGEIAKEDNSSLGLQIGLIAGAAALGAGAVTAAAVIKKKRDGSKAKGAADNNGDNENKENKEIKEESTKEETK